MVTIKWYQNWYRELVFVLKNKEKKQPTALAVASLIYS